MVQLQVYVQPHCPQCTRARRLAQWAGARFPDVQIQIVEMAEPSAPIPEFLIGVPTYVLAGQVISLGNPTEATLGEQIERAVARERRTD
ncbi:MAG: hypothetical protein ACR2PL_11745 [Dehalococcoidia bacterium]